MTCTSEGQARQAIFLPHEGRKKIAWRAQRASAWDNGLTRKYVWIFVRKLIGSEKRTVLILGHGLLPRTNFQAYYFLRQTGGYCVYYPSNVFRNTRDLKTGEHHSDIHLRDAFRPITSLNCPSSSLAHGRGTRDVRLRAWDDEHFRLTNHVQAGMFDRLSKTCKCATCLRYLLLSSLTGDCEA